MSAINKCKSGGGLIANFRLRVPIGELEMSCCSRGLHELHTKRANIFPQPCDKLKTVELAWQDNPDLKYKTIDESVDYFRFYFSPHESANPIDELMDKTPSICWRGICLENSFTDKVMKTLLNQVGPGSRVSYTELASMSGNAKAQRAVGTVMRKNPIALIVPCHRVVKSDRTIGNYNGGVDIKEWLLSYEKIYFQEC